MTRSTNRSPRRSQTTAASPALRERSTPTELAGAVDAVRRLVRGLRLAEHRTRAATGLSAAQLFVLGQLRDTEAASLTELAARTLTDRSSVTAVVERLARDGFARTERDSRDRRRLVVRITGAGARRLASAPQPPTVRLVTALRRLPAREVRALTAHLVALLGAMGLADEPATMLFEDDGGRTRRSRA